MSEIKEIIEALLKFRNERDWAQFHDTKNLADFTLTLRINKSTFLPIEIKYDPKNANVFGYFKLKWDNTCDN